MKHDFLNKIKPASVGLSENETQPTALHIVPLGSIGAHYNIQRMNHKRRWIRRGRCANQCGKIDYSI